MFSAASNGVESESTSVFASSVQLSQPCRQFEFSEIHLATKNFALVIGSGGFGKVYKGNVLHGSRLVPAAIKRLDHMSDQGASVFWAEVEMLSKLRHCHLVSLFGYCNHGKDMILDYEYMPNGTLEEHLHKLRTPLSWLQQLKIYIGAARAINYLHTGTGIKLGVIHRDVKTSNILLHESWAAKISDFGLSMIGPTNQPTYVNTLVKGTFGYLDPNYFTTGRLTRKSDVYSFGVVLLEVICRKPVVDRSLDEEQWGLVTWAQDSIKEGNLKHIIDSDIRAKISPKCLKEFVRIAERCLVSNPKQRPTMAEVVVGLESVLTLQEKVNSSMQTAGRTSFGRMLDCFSSPSNEENSDLPSPSLRVIGFADLKRATRNFSRDLLLDPRGDRRIFLGWVDQKTFTPSKRDIGIAVAVKRFDQESRLDHEEWQDFNAKLGYLGLAKSGPAIGERRISIRTMETMGYAAPEYIATGHLMMNSNIYSIGVVLLETLTGKQALDRNRRDGQENLVEWAKPIIKESSLDEIMDPRVEHDYTHEAVSKCAALVLQCLEDNSKDRPSSEEVLQTLEEIYAVNE